MENTAAQSSSGRPQFGSAFTLFGPSKHAVGINFWTFILTYLAGIIPAGILTAIAVAIPSSSSSSSGGSAKASAFVSLLIITVIVLVITFAISPAITYITLQGAQGNHVGVGGALKAGLHFFWRYAGLFILMMVMMFVSLILLIVPFFFVFPRIMLAPYYLIDRDLGPIQALKQSMADYKKYHGTWGVIGVLVLFELPSLIPFIGWIATLVLEVMYACAPALRYFQIKNVGMPQASGAAGAVVGGGPAQPMVVGGDTAAMPTPITNPMSPQAPMPQANPQPTVPPATPPQQPPTPPRPLVQ